MPGLIGNAIGGYNARTEGQSPLSAIMGGILSHIPAYQLGGSLLHLATGTLGQHGPAVSPLGRLSQALGLFAQQPGMPITSETNNPPMYGTTVDTPTDPNQPGAPIQAGGRPGMPSGMPAFSPTIFQQHFPGSAIGPLSTGYSDPNARLPTGIGNPGGTNDIAMGLLAQLKARNLI